MMTIREYKRAESLEEAWQLNQKKPNRILGGMIWLKMETINVGTAIDLSGLGLDTIEETEDSFSIGAMVTLRQLETHPGLEAFTHGAVREALRQLELEGLVSIIPNKGAYVTGITRKDVEDIYAIRSLLEGLCARWATAHITEKQLDALEENIYLSEFHASKGHAQKLTELDDQFHDILYEACSSKMLEHQLRDFHEYVRRMRKQNLSGSERGLEAVLEHKQIMEAIRRKDADHRSWQPCICAMLMII